MFERFTEQARRTLIAARQEASDLDSAFIETEHLLLALRRETEGIVARVFERGELSYRAIRREVEARTSRRASTSSTNEVPFSEQTKRVFLFAAQEAERLLHRHIGAEHLLLALFWEGLGLAAVILRARGFDLANVRDQIVQARSGAELPAGIPFAHPPGVPGRTLRISPNRGEGHEGSAGIVPRLTARGLTLRELIAWAYRSDPRHVDLPSRLDGPQRYDARLFLSGVRDWNALDRAAQDGLASHFSIVVTRQTTMTDVFVLTAMDARGPGRRKHEDHAEGAGVSTSFASFSTVAFTDAPEEFFSVAAGPEWRNRLQSIGPILLTATTIAHFARQLEEMIGRPVIDDTGLRGTYDLEVQGDLQGLDELRHALAAQLALALTPAQRPLDILVVRSTAK